MVSTHMCLVWVSIQHDAQPRECHNIFLCKTILMLLLEIPLYIKI